MLPLFLLVLTLQSQAVTPTVVRGRVVAYDWTQHGEELRYSDSLIVRLSGSSPEYVRVYYVGESEHFSDAERAARRLPERLFVGRGPLWEFTLLKPSDNYDASLCRPGSETISVSDELGSVEIPRFIPTPGTSGENLPPPHMLPCFIMHAAPVLVLDKGKGVRSAVEAPAFRRG